MRKRTEKIATRKISLLVSRATDLKAHKKIKTKIKRKERKREREYNAWLTFARPPATSPVRTQFKRATAHPAGTNEREAFGEKKISKRRGSAFLPSHCRPTPPVPRAFVSLRSRRSNLHMGRATYSTTCRVKVRERALMASATSEPLRPR